MAHSAPIPPPVAAGLTHSGCASTILTAPESALFPQPHGLQADVSPRPKCVLVVEADPELRRKAQAALESKGHRVFACDDALRAFRTFGKWKSIDVLVTDLHMPYMTGLQLAREATMIHHSLAVLIASATFPRMELVEYMDQRGWRFLSKPYGPAVLLSTVQELLSPEQPKVLYEGRPGVKSIPASLRMPTKMAG
jgi:DNA-binding response OmpR family regulator